MTATIETAADFHVGQRVQINYPPAPEWNSTGTVVRVSPLYVVVPDTGEWADIEGGFTAEQLTPVEDVVQSLDGFRVGDSVVVNTDGFYVFDIGDPATVTNLDEPYIYADVKGAFSFPFRSHELAHADDTPSFSVGDRVLVAADAKTTDGGDVYFGSAVKGTVIAFDIEDDGNVLVEGPGIFAQYVDPKYLTLLTDGGSSEVVPDSELIGASVMDLEGLRALPVGTVMRSNDTFAIGYLTPYGWLTPDRIGDQTEMIERSVTDYSGGTVIAVVDVESH